MLTGKRRRFAVGTAERRLPPVNPALSAASRFPPSSECDGPTLGLTDRRVSNCAAADYSRRNGGCGIHSAVADTPSDSKSPPGWRMPGAGGGADSPSSRERHAVTYDSDRGVVILFGGHKKGAGTAIGSLLLGLYDDTGVLQHVGVCSSFTDEKRKELVDFLAR